jgi:hypothetical protein
VKKARGPFSQSGRSGSKQQGRPYAKVKEGETSESGEMSLLHSSLVIKVIREMVMSISETGSGSREA